MWPRQGSTYQDKIVAKRVHLLLKNNDMKIRPAAFESSQEANVYWKIVTMQHVTQCFQISTDDTQKVWLVIKTTLKAKRENTFRTYLKQNIIIATNISNSIEKFLVLDWAELLWEKILLMESMRFSIELPELSKWSQNFLSVGVPTRQTMVCLK